MSSKAERVVYIGLESVAPGTGVNVDVALRAKCSLKPKPEKIVVDEDIGSFAPARHYIGSLMAEGEIEIPAAYYDHLPYPVSMAMGQGATVFNNPDTDWTFALIDDTPDTFATYSTEYGDGANHIVRALDVFATGLEISGEEGKAWAVKVPIVGGQTTKPAAHSATPTPPASPRTIKMADTKLYIDDTFAGIGGTEVAVLISFNWKLENLQHQKMFAGALWPTGRGTDKWKTTLELIVEVEEATIEAELDKILTEDLSAVRIHADDSTAASTYDAKINGMYHLSEIDTLDDRDGNNIIKLTYLGQKDGSNNTGSVTCNSALAAL